MRNNKSYFFSTDKLTVGYNGKPLISDITVDIRRGEILSLIGPNGSGKSTILKSVTKHLASLSGLVYIDNKSTRLMSNRETATKMSVVLTDRIKPELMTCGELVATGRYPYTNSFGRLTREDKEIVARSLALVRAEDLSGRDFSAISDGQRQRIMLARAICQQPKIIVLDEPTSFLDIRHKIELLGILRDMSRRQKITVVMSLHEIDLAYKISDKIMCVKGDRIHSFGQPDEIFRSGMIRELYDIENGSYDIAFGSVELGRPAGEARVFAVGGNGHGIPFYRALQKLDVPFAAGILFENDIDYRVASALAHCVVSQGAFTPIKDAQVSSALKLIDSVDYVADCGCGISDFNRANAVLMEEAKKRGKTILSSLSEINRHFGGTDDD